MTMKNTKELQEQIFQGPSEVLSTSGSLSFCSIAFMFDLQEFVLFYCLLFVVSSLLLLLLLFFVFSVTAIEVHTFDGHI